MQNLTVHENDESIG